MDSKICARCNKKKSMLEFSENKGYKEGYDRYCRECRRGYNKKYSQEHRAERLAYKRAYQESRKIPCPDCGDPIHLGSNYCRPCASRRIWQQPEVKESYTKKRKQWWADDPDGEKRQAASERLKARRKDPGYRSREEERLRQWREERRGQSISEETSLRISEGVKKAWADGKFDNRNYNEESKKKKSESIKRLWEEGHYDEMLANIGRDPTDLELDLAYILDCLELEHISQHRPDGCSYIYDEYIPELDLLIEADGEHWHYSEWAKNQGVPEKDARKDQWATDNNYHIAHVRGRDVESRGMKACLSEQLFSQLELRD